MWVTCLRTGGALTCGRPAANAVPPPCLIARHVAADQWHLARLRDQGGAVQLALANRPIGILEGLRISRLECSSLPQHQGQAASIDGEYMEDVYDALAERVLDRVAALQPGTRFMVGIVGAPGSGKTSAAAAVAELINSKAAARGMELGGGDDGSGAGAPPLAAVVPMDGFHYTRAELDAMPDPDEAHARRGAHWTFDAAAFVECARALRSGGHVAAPSFDHAAGDPVPEDILVAAGTRVVLLEGLYLLLDLEPWAQLGRLLDERWFIDCPLDEAMARVFARQTAIGLAPQVSAARIAGNDRPNGELVASSAARADVLVPSRPLRGAGVAAC